MSLQENLSIKNHSNHASIRTETIKEHLYSSWLIIMGLLHTYLKVSIGLFRTRATPDYAA